MMDANGDLKDFKEGGTGDEEGVRFDVHELIDRKRYRSYHAVRYGVSYGWKNIDIIF